MSTPTNAHICILVGVLIKWLYETQGATMKMKKEEPRSVGCRKYSSLISFRNSRIVGRDSSDSTATSFGLDGPGIESRWRRDFPNPWAHPAFCTMGTGSLSPR